MVSQSFQLLIRGTETISETHEGEKRHGTWEAVQTGKSGKTGKTDGEGAQGTLPDCHIATSPIQAVWQSGSVAEAIIALSGLRTMVR